MRRQLDGAGLETRTGPEAYAGSRADAGDSTALIIPVWRWFVSVGFQAQVSVDSGPAHADDVADVCRCKPLGFELARPLDLFGYSAVTSRRPARRPWSVAAAMPALVRSESWSWADPVM